MEFHCRPHPILIPSHPIPSIPSPPLPSPSPISLLSCLAQACPVWSLFFLPDNPDLENNQKIGNRLLILHALLLSWINLIQLVLVHFIQPQPLLSVNSI